MEVSLWSHREPGYNSSEFLKEARGFFKDLGDFTNWVKFSGKVKKSEKIGKIREV